MTPAFGMQRQENFWELKSPWCTKHPEGHNETLSQRRNLCVPPGLLGMASGPGTCHHQPCFLLAHRDQSVSTTVSFCSQHL